MYYPKIDEIEPSLKSSLNDRFSLLDNLLQDAYAKTRNSQDAKQSISNCIAIFDIIKMRNERLIIEAEKLQKYLDDQI